MDSQKIRTPKGLDWIKAQYANLNQTELMGEMQKLNNLHCVIWAEGVREIVSAEESETKFIISDHPVTIYNHTSDPLCRFDPSIQLKASQTIFPLDRNTCLILTNLEYAKDPSLQIPNEPRTNANYMRDSLLRTDNFIRYRKLNNSEVSKINLAIKKEPSGI